MVPPLLSLYSTLESLSLLLLPEPDELSSYKFINYFNTVKKSSVKSNANYSNTWFHQRR